jgi:hypothetical protein
LHLASELGQAYCVWFVAEVVVLFVLVRPLFAGVKGRTAASHGPSQKSRCLVGGEAVGWCFRLVQSCAEKQLQRVQCFAFAAAKRGSSQWLPDQTDTLQCPAPPTNNSWTPAAPSEWWAHAPHGSLSLLSGMSLAHATSTAPSVSQRQWQAGRVKVAVPVQGAPAVQVQDCSRCRAGIQCHLGLFKVLQLP